MNNIVFVNFECNESTKVVAQKIWQYDYGQILRIQGLNLPAAVEIHFSLQKTGGEAKRRIGKTSSGVTDVVIPDFILEGDGATSDYEAYAFIYLSSEESGETTHKIKMKIKSRPEPEGSTGSNETSFGAIMDALKTFAAGKADGLKYENSILKLMSGEAELARVTIKAGEGTGSDAREIELQKSDTAIQWRYVGDEEWTDLVLLEELKGEKGDPGEGGKTAYQYAQDGGYTGTEEEFAKKLAQENPTREEFSQLSDTVNNIKQNGTGTGSGVTVPTFLNGLKYYALGDSIVDNQGTTALPETFGSIGYTNDLQGNNISDITVKGYIQAIEEKYGLVCTNYGKAGHTIVGDFSTIMALDYSDVALVTIAYGVNDARTGVTLGTVNSTDGTTFAGALNQILRKIYTDNPECRVIVLTPLQRLYVSEFGIATPNANGDYLIDFVDMCKKVAQKRSTRCIDMYRDSGINQTNLYFYTVEGVHPLNPCYLRMAMPILKTLEEMTLLEFEPFGTMTNTGDTEPDEPDTGGSGSEDNPPEEEIGATEVDISSRLTKDGYYYDGYTSVMGRGSYSGIELPLIELIEGKTYTLETYTNGNTDSRYAAVSIDENASNGTYLSYSSTDTDGNWVFTLVADGVYKASITWVAGEQKRNVSGVQTPCLYLSFGCLKGYEAQAKLSYI